MSTILRGAPYIILSASVIAYLITNQLTPLRFVGYYLITELVASLLKKFNRVVFSNYPQIYRPTGAGHCIGCSAVAQYSTDGHCINVDDKVGMPSGHAMGAAMTAVFWSLWIWNTSGTVTSKLIRITVVAILALLVILSRTALVENCHSYLQVTVGAVIGAALGVGFYTFERQF